MQITAQDWLSLSALLDEAFELEGAARAQWLERAGHAHPALLPALRRLLDAHEAATTDPLQGLPLLPTTHDDAADGLIPGQRIGPYSLVRRLGSGGMATVWLAQRADGVFERDVALKLPQSGRLRPDLAGRFARERDILARLEHPLIARLYDAGVAADGMPYLAMEYVDGAPLTAWCDARRLPVAARLELFAQVLDALQYAHARLVIHRDLKPSNILVTSSGQVRLLDFGIAKMLADDERAGETQMTRLAGRALTPDYASPEQIRGEPLAVATDVYSLGVVLYELLAGCRPYRLRRASAATLEQAILAEDPPAPSRRVDEAAAQARTSTVRRLARALTGDLDTIVLKALAKAPAQRYPTAAAFAEDLRRQREGEPVLARRASLAYRTDRFVRRNTLAVGAASAIAIALLVGTGVSLWQAQLARAQAQRAEQVKRFVLSMFEEADTYSVSGGSRAMSVVDLLKQARLRLAAAQISDPAIQVELLNSIGRSLTGLGEHATAAEVLGESRRVAESRLSADHPERHAALLELGGAMILLGRLKDAGPLIAEAEAGMRRTDNTLALMTALRWKAFLLAHEREFDASVAAAAEAVRLAEAQPQLVDRRILMESYLTLAGAMGSAHRSGRLEPTRRAYEMAREIYADRPTVGLLHAHSLYAYTLIVEGDAGHGIAELQALLPQQIALLGPDHVEVKASYSRIGTASLARGDVLTAIATYREALRGELAASGGAINAGVALQRYRLGAALAAARRYDEALTELRAAVAAFATHPHGEAPQAAATLALVLARMGQLDEAQAAFPPLAPETAAIDRAALQLRLGTLRSLQERHAEAQDLLQRAVDYYAAQAALPSAHARALEALGEAQRRASALTAAGTTLEQARALFERLQPAGSPDLADVNLDLARAYLALGRSGEGQAAAERAVLFWDRFDAHHASAVEARNWRRRAEAAMADQATAQRR